MSDQGHIEITVDSTATPLAVDPQSYQEVDVVDFAPQAISGTPALSELGLYVDVAQDGFGHGFGQWRFAEPKSFAYAGSLVDTRKDVVQLMTANAVDTYAGTSTNLTGSTVFDGHLASYISPDGVSVPVWSNLQFELNREINTGKSYLYAPSQDFWVGITSATTGMTTTSGDWYAQFWNAGKYMFITQPVDGQLKLAMIAKCTGYDGGTKTLTFDASVAFESTNLWQNGYVWNYDVAIGTSEIRGIASSTANTLVHSGASFTVTPANTYVLFWVDVGSAGNPPEGYDKIKTFGGLYWANEWNTNYLHYWAELDGHDAEGGGTTDLGVVKVGPPGQPIVNMTVFNNQLWVFRPDGAWVVGEDMVAYHVLDFSQEAHPLNFIAVATWNGFLYFTVRQKIYKFRSGLQDITPPPFTEDPPRNTFGEFRGLVTRGSYLYVTATANRLFADETDESGGQFTAFLAYDGVGWHKLDTLSTVTSEPYVHGVGLETAGNKLHVWFAKFLDPTTVCEMRYFQLQEFSDLPYADYPTSGDHNLYTSYYDLGMKRIPKSWASLTLEGYFPVDVTDYASVDVEFRVDDDTAWTTLGTFSSNMQEIAFPTGTEGKRIQFRLNLQTTKATLTPVVQTVIMKAMMRPDVLYGVTTNVIVSSDLSDTDGQQLGLTAEEIRTALKAARASVSPIGFKDIHGNSANAYLSSVQFIITEYEHLDKMEEVARCTFVYV